MAAINKIASAAYNDIVSGLRGYHTNFSMSIEQLEDEVVNTRLSVIKEYSLKGILPIKDLLISVNCVDVDCQDIDRCKCNTKYTGTPVAHFEIPQIISDYGESAIDYIGSTDRQQPFIIYTSSYTWNYYSKYRKRGKNKPFVFLDLVPNKEGMLDGFIFNAPMIEQLSVVAVFKDPRQLEMYGCCSNLNDENMNFIDDDVQKIVTEQKIKYYRQLAATTLPNNQEYTPG